MCKSYNLCNATQLVCLALMFQMSGSYDETSMVVIDSSKCIHGSQRDLPLFTFPLVRMSSCSVASWDGNRIAIGSKTTLGMLNANAPNH